ncbi:short-chain dehydrogenase/reductase SDR [Haladaptatus paucihalophilus DX253]|uniref:NAD(P)-dependent dehydrogenase, short-chain alcohol dehydrogenase family n=2 Tax=Haladaptataceae TaxID=3064797 RepID=E7QZ35_HALPU|nr:short-chain dehydrogenase/reductase SDR [Haladaptatus paucihalophilus DX253]SHL08239.1 NAD(P)-dependent dehydrogenase, short-chain alcohol dehydrogenase family [Haladaptatus paucihalophilus DX253]
MAFCRASEPVAFVVISGRTVLWVPSGGTIMTVLDAFDLQDQTAIVTGGNRGIGRAIATALADVGANVVVANRSAASGEAVADELADTTGVETLAVECDVTDEDDVAAMVEATVERFGGIDVLVNNAGIVVHEAAETMSLDEWHAVIETNLTGAFLCSRAAGREMMGDGGGVILNVSSMSAFIANHPQRQVAYNASKAGLEGFKNQLASEWAEHGIRVNNLAPGYVATDNADQGAEVAENAVDIWTDEMLQDEMASPEMLGPTAVYLASDASAYMTGETIVLDGGYTVR